jgi:hypothetical protein
MASVGLVVQRNMGIYIRWLDGLEIERPNEKLVINLEPDLGREVEEVLELPRLKVVA